MHKMFEFAATLMGRLKYPQKMGLVAFIFAIPLAISLYLLVDRLNSDMRFTQQQRLGIEYESALMQLYRLIPEHRGLTNAQLNGDASLGGKIAAKRNGIRDSIAMVDAVERNHGQKLESTERWLAIKQKWRDLENAGESLDASKSFSAHAGLIAEIGSLIAHVADTSNLILDSQLDSHYLIETALLRIPSAMEETAQARGLGVGIAARVKPDPEDTSRLLTLVANIQLAGSAIERALDVAFRANPKLLPNIDTIHRAQSAATLEFLNLIRKSLIGAETIQIQPSELFAGGTRAIAAQASLYEAIIAALDDMIMARAQHLTEKKHMIQAAVGTTLLIVIYLYAGFYLSVIQSVQALTKTARQIARGDLSNSRGVVSQDELAQVAEAFNDMSQEFNRVISSVARASAEVAHSATELSVVTTQTSQGVLKQQDGTEQVAAAIEQMAASVQHVASSAYKAAESAQTADERAESGREVVVQAIAAIENLANEVEHAATVISALGEDTKQIWSILDVINDVTEQTNLLALNAAIEAARAGEYGRGFAVVADEVRKLANRTQLSTQEIQQKIEQLQKNALEAVRVMDAGRVQARLGVEQAEKANISLQSITDAVAGINQINAQIAAAAEQQNKVADDVSRNIQAISQVAEETADGAKQNATHSDQMARLAAQMQGMVKQFQALEEI